ncbi:MAG: hypothetical protein JWN61_2221, partial [Pseudonocardiales bacterium]|nr:hypothetical protein [Pseudonocardiales bacterium]
MLPSIALLRAAVAAVRAEALAGVSA